MSLTLSDGVIAPHDVSSRRALLCFATGAAVCNYGHGRWASLNMAGADLSRLNSGRALLLSDHEFRLAAVLGVIEAAWIDGDSAFAVARFAGTQAATEAWELVRDRIVSCVSMGFRLGEELEDTTPDAPGIIERWQPIEVSLVTVPANWNARAFADAPEEEMRRVVSANVDRRGLELTEALQKFQEQSRRDAALSLAPAVAARLGTDPNLTAAALADAAAQ